MTKFLYYVVLAQIFIYMLMLILLPLWIYATTKNWDLALSNGDESEIKKHPNLTKAQAFILVKMKFLRHLVGFSGFFYGLFLMFLK